MAPIKVIHWATGYTGRFGLKYEILNPTLEVVGLRVYGADKVGQDAGTIAGLDPIGVTATDDVDALLALDADCVVYTPGMYDMQDPLVQGSSTHQMLQDVLAILRSGKNVVTSVCPLIDFDHYASGAEVKALIEEACVEHGVSFFGTGFEPGFMGDVLPLTIASSCGQVETFTATEFLDYSQYPAFETLQMMGFGQTPEAIGAAGIEGVALTWGSVPRVAARGLGVTLDEVQVEAEVFLAPERFEIAGGGVIEQGTIAALLFRLVGVVGGRRAIVLQHVNRLRDDMAPDWPRLDPTGGYRIEITGTNPLVADFHLGLPGGEGPAFTEAMAMTAARCVNAVGAVVAAEPGVHTFLDLPPITGVGTMPQKI